MAFGILFAGASSAGTQATSGPYTDRTFQPFTASNGLSSQYHVFAAGLTPTTPACVVFHFHGDGAYEFKNPTASYSLGGANGIVAVSRQHGCVTVPVLTPDKVGSITWWENGAANALFVLDLVAKIKSDYLIDNNRMWLVGYSGGAQLITQFYLPLYSNTLGGGSAVLFGGGGSPYNVSDKPYAAELTSRLRMHWYTGANDIGAGGGFNALRDAQRSEVHYKSKGFVTSHEYPINTGHALNGRFGAVLSQQFDLPVAGSTAGPVPSTAPAPSSSPAPSIGPAPSTSTVTDAPAWSHRITPSTKGATATINVPAATSRTTLRVSASPFGTQTGFYVYTTGTGAGTVLTLSSSLSPGRTYFYQIEAGAARQIVGSGTFTTVS